MTQFWLDYTICSFFGPFILRLITTCLLLQRLIARTSNYPRFFYYQDAAEAYRDLRKLVDASEKETLRKIKAAHKFKKDELTAEMNIYEGHLKENQQALDKVHRSS